MAHMFSLMATLDAATTLCDTDAMLRFVDASPAADGRRIGAVGYCMSGPFVMWAAAARPERLACIASIHGANMVTDKPDSPHRMPPKIRCESYFACAEIDKWAPPADVEKLQAALRDAGTPHRVEWYPGRRARLRLSAAPACLRPGRGRAPLGAPLQPVRAHAARAGRMTRRWNGWGSDAEDAPLSRARTALSRRAHRRRRAGDQRLARDGLAGGRRPAGCRPRPRSRPTRPSASTTPSARARPTGSRCAAAASAGWPTASPCRHRTTRPSPRSTRRSGSARSSFPMAAAPASSAICACPKATGRWSTSRSSGWRRCRRSMPPT